MNLDLVMVYTKDPAVSVLDNKSDGSKPPNTLFPYVSAISSKLFIER